MIKRILPLLICLSIILSVAPAVVLADDPGYMDYCTDSNKIIDYTFNNAFYENDLADLAIVEFFDEPTDGFKAAYTNNGLTITRTQDAAATSNFLLKFAFNFVTLDEENSSNNTAVYKAGLSGVYAVELTVNTNFNVTGKRTDFYFNDDMATSSKVWKGPNGSSSNNFRFTTANVAFWYNNSVASTHFKDFTNGVDYTVRIVVDTVNGKVYLYDADDFAYLGEHTYVGNTLTSLTWSPNQYMGKDDSLTFKSLKVYEIDANENYSGNDALESFKAALPDSIVSDTENVIDNVEIPESLTAAGNVSTLNEDLIKSDGTITRRFEDTKTGIKVSNNKDGMYYEKRYNFTVKAMDGVDIKTISQYDFSDSNVSDEFVRSVNGQITSDGYEITNTKEIGEIIGLLKTEETSDTDTYTNTYYYDHNGAFDYEVSLTPNVTNGKAVVEVGNYNKDTDFTSFGTVEISSDKIVYCGSEDDVVAIAENTSGNSYDIKFRTYTDENGLWIYVNDNAVSVLPYSYEVEKNVLNAYRVTFENATENDSVVVKDATLTHLFSTENAVLESCLDAAGSIGVLDVVSNPLDAYGDLTLPSVAGYDIEWTSSSPLANVESKRIFRTTDDTDIVISAVITGVSNPDIKVLKEFNITVLGTDDPTYLLEGALAKIVPEKITNQNPDALIADLELPSTTEEGYTIDWDSLNDDVISDSGKIIKNKNIDKNTEVKLKATVTSPDGSDSKEISFVVAKRGEDVDCELIDITEVAENVVTYYAEISNTDGSMYLHDGNNNKIISFSVLNSKLIFANGIEYQLSNDTFILKAVMNSNDQKLSVFVDEDLVIDYVKYEEKTQGFKSVYSSGLTLSNEKVIFDEYSLFDYNVKLFDYFDNLGEGYINKNVVLKTNSIGGVDVKWTSSDIDILTDDGTYSAQDSISFFDVTAKLTVNGGTDAYYEKTVECVAVPGEDKNIFKGATATTTIKQDIDNDKTKGFDNNFETYFEGTKLNENSYITIDMGGLNDINSVYLFRDADDNNLKSCDIYSSEDGIEWSKVTSVSFEGFESNRATFDLQNARYIKIANIVTEDKTIKLYEIKGYVSYSSDDKAYKDIMALNMPADYELTHTSITLPTVGLLYGSTLVWKSSDESVISTNGTIVKPSGNKAKEVVLTVKATYEGKTSVKSFKYLVSGDGSISGGIGGSGGGGGGGNISGVNTGGTTITALPDETEIVQTSSEDNLKTEFKDVKISDWFYTYLIKLKNKGIIDGYDDGNFYPNNNITREEFIKLLVSAAGLDLAEASEGFEDVKETDWFALYVYTAKDKGIVNGIDDTNFGVGMPVSRQDMSVMIYNLITMKKDVSASKDKFTDDSNIADYASKAVYSMKALEILNGYEDGTFNPQGQLTRAEAVKVISLVMNVL